MVPETDETDVGARYDWWSRHPRALDVLYDVAFLGREDTFRHRAIQTLDVPPGARILEVGCGNGNGFPALRSAVGSDGSVVGLDVSRGMVRAANHRVRDRGWENVTVIRGDARALPLADEAFDAAYAAMSISAVPDPERAIEAIRATLRPGGRFVVLDAQPFQAWPWRPLNWIIDPVATYATNWVPEVDLVAALRREFETVEVSTFNAGSILLARAETPGGE